MVFRVVKKRLSFQFEDAEGEATASISVALMRLPHHVSMPHYRSKPRSIQNHPRMKIASTVLLHCYKIHCSTLITITKQRSVKLKRKLAAQRQR